MKQKIGIMGGSFNPIHIGHLHLAESARIEFGLDLVIFVPTGDNPFKHKNDGIDREHRYRMVELAIASNPYFAATRIEIDRYGNSYTIDTVRDLKSRLPEDDLFLITGADIVFELPKWREAEELMQSVAFISAYRPGYPKRKFDRQIKTLQKKYGARIYKLLSSEMDVASTDIRKRLSNNQSIRYLIPENVEAYIRENHLYHC
ncbi:MAG: nicotinate-nucleotide adenylyltransferase [Eubacteriaceae bacterium]|nr:nicotinate-nucleotide adenylyltransferase [Eubacteriaceae bacterium]